MKPDELTQEELDHLRRRLRVSVPEPPPPVTFAGIGSAARRRQRRRWAVVAAASGMAVVVGLGGAIAVGADIKNDSGASVASTRLDGGTVTLNVASTPAKFILQARVGGKVAVDDTGCVYLQAGNRREDVVWPHGFRGRIGSDGRVQILDETGRAILTEGQSFSASGGAVSLNEDAAVMSCRAASGPVTLVQATVRPG